MEKQHLIDFADWLWDMDRLKVTTQLPPFENSGMMVELYLKAKMLNDECEGKADRTSEKDLRVCEVIASAFFKVTFSYLQGNPRGGIPYWKEEIKVYEASNETELNTKINAFLSDDNCGYQKHKKIVDVCKL